MEEIFQVEPEGNSKYRLTTLLSHARELENSGVTVFNQIEESIYLLFASSKGGKAFTHDTYLKFAYESETRSDGQIARENFCDQIVIQNARQGLIAISDLILKQYGYQPGIALSDRELETQQRFQKTLENRGYTEAQNMAENCEQEHPSLQMLLKYYARTPTVKFIFQELNISHSEEDIQYYDVAMRAFVKGKERSKGFPRLADRVIFGWLLKQQPEEDISKMMQLCSDVLRFKSGYLDHEYYRHKKVNTFLRTIITEDINRHIPNPMLTFRVPYALKRKPTHPPTLQTIDEYIEPASFYSIHSLFRTLPLSMIDIFESIAQEKNINYNNWIVNPTRPVLSEGLRVIKGMLLTDYVDCDSSSLLMFSSEDYYDSFRARMLETVKKPNQSE